jgi:hypothetical protein
VTDKVIMKKKSKFSNLMLVSYKVAALIVSVVVAIVEIKEILKENEKDTK